MAIHLGSELQARGLTICAAESCTGGLFLSTLTDISGSSAYVLGGIVAYSNAVKQQFLGVQAETLVQQGAVSAATAREMALGVQQRFASDIAISITGIAGPSGGSEEKPVGLVYIGMAFEDHIRVTRNVWQGNRVENKEHSVEAALQMVLDSIGTQ